jgi:signal transduction histidine kinase
MLTKAKQVIDWFIPHASMLERSDRSMARNFVFTHLCGPLLSQSISVYLYRTDRTHGIACWTMIVCVCLFWALPFLFKFSRNLQISALLSVELLAFTSLFGTYFYGGVNSPFLPWLIVDLLLGFFYLSERPVLVVMLFAVNIGGLLVAYFWNGFPQLVPLADLATVGWISILSATVYMSWMAMYYANVMATRSEVERETERHRITAVKLQETKVLADAANHAKSIFLAKMSHELRTPLNAVIGYSELLLEVMEPGETSQSKANDLRCINAAGKHLLSLVTDVLDLSKIEADKVEINVESFSLDALIDQVMATSQPLAAKNSNTLTVQRQSNLGIADTDQTKLRQVLLNLMSNACKFTKGGTISLVVKRDRRSTGDWIEMQVRDSGIGIAPADVEKLFQNFQQVSAATSGKYGGTGLGLALSQKLCALMGGGITVSSELGRGSCFTVRIPAQVTSEEAEVEAEIPDDDDDLPFPAPLAA